MQSDKKNKIKQLPIFYNMINAPVFFFWCTLIFSYQSFSCSTWGRTFHAFQLTWVNVMELKVALTKTVVGTKIQVGLSDSYLVENVISFA